MRSINLTDTPGGHTEDEEKDSAADLTGNGYKVGEIGCRARVGPISDPS